MAKQLCPHFTGESPDFLSLGLHLYPRLVWNSQQSSCLSAPVLECTRFDALFLVVTGWISLGPFYMFPPRAQSLCSSAWISQGLLSPPLLGPW